MPGFDICRNNHGGNQQSEEANDSIVHLKGNLRNRILVYIRAVPSTCEETESALSLPHTTCSARISELKSMKLVRESGKVRANASGRNAAVLEAVPEFELTSPEPSKFVAVESTLRARLLDAIARYGKAEVEAATSFSPKLGIQRATELWTEIETLVDKALAR